MAESQLLCYFGADNAPTQSTWREEHLNRWYSQADYFDKWSTPPDGLSYSGYTLAKEMDALKLPKKLGDRGLTQFYWAQDQEFEFNGKSFPLGTQGSYMGTINVERGFISAEGNRSPFQKKNDPYPPLYKMSGVYFLEWQRQATENKNIKKLRYFFRYHIKNEDTLTIIQKITNGFTALTEWPGTEFVIHKKTKGQVQDTDEGKALLRTPNGVGVAYFLLTNKRVLGKRIPDTVRIWKTQEGPNAKDFWVHMLFHIVEYKGI
ncbi:Mitochondrial import inner membrane translocase subunit tim8 [Aspergillus melleus]|uniref:Mitochondrial import inner membrane translocase subunit tim8 n=1 Tax=Aspergillus melleus TaxID=138277 RepID=UPI001E8D247D|nr:Mitochondrial import inner membrane translocase subunit tim8 [Aspergillus melleus]KAH8430879.1 Mitochondrial import inner membrane translocase subunit tim8 [Aspergillus melleus]